MSAPLSRLENGKAPSTIGEWDQEIATLRVMRQWDSFNKAFAWTRIFVLEQSIDYELEKREEETTMTVSQKRIKKAHDALGVIALDPKIRSWLIHNDPKALHQAEEARADLGLELEPWEAPKR